MKNPPLIAHSRRWDRTGIVVSLLCLIHCLALPVLILALPITEKILGHFWLEISMMLVALSVGIFSFTTSYFRHRKKLPVAIGGFGLLLLAMSLTRTLGLNPWLSPLPDHHSLTQLDPFLFAGGALLVWAHFLNIRACHCFCDDHCHDEEHLAH